LSILNKKGKKMSAIGQILNINQNMHIPAYLYAEHIAQMKFSDEFSKIAAKEKEDKVKEVREVEESSEIDTNISKDEQRENAKQAHHIDLKG
jgi:hypothetical protein